MTRRWQDAITALDWLSARSDAAAAFLLVARLAPLDLTLVSHLTCASPSAARERVALLEERGLIGALRPAYRSPPPPRQLYPTDLGVAVLSLAWDSGARELAAALRLRRADLWTRAARLFEHMDASRLLALLASSRAGPVELLAWEEPWRRRQDRAGWRGFASAVVPAYAALAWNGEGHGYFLVPDAETTPVAAFRPLVRVLVALRDREMHGLAVHDFPRVIVATTSASRCAEWERMLDEPDRNRRAGELAHTIVIWDQPSGDLACAPGQRALRGATAWRLPPGRPARPVEPDRPISIVVGDPASPPPVRAPARQRVGFALLQATPGDLRLLARVGRSGPGEAASFARAENWRVQAVEERLERLMALGLVRRIDRSEVERWPADTPFPAATEITCEGLAAWAALLRRPPASVARLYGVIGGGPDHPIGQRPDAIARLAHAVGFAACMALFEGALFSGSAGWRGATLLACENAACCGAGSCRPDGWFRLRVDGRVYEAFVEYERGTAKGEEGYPKKFRRFHERYAQRYQPAPPYPGHPSRPLILIVVDHHRDQAWEASGKSLDQRLALGDRLADRIARAVRREDASAEARLPIYLAVRQRLEIDPRSVGGHGWRDQGSPRSISLPIAWADLSGSMVAPLLPDAAVQQGRTMPRKAMGFAVAGA